MSVQGLVHRTHSAAAALGVTVILLWAHGAASTQLSCRVSNDYGVTWGSRQTILTETSAIGSLAGLKSPEP